MRETREITVETHTVTVIKTRNGQRSKFCEHCRQTVAALSRSQIFELLQLESDQNIDPKIHMINTNPSEELICSQSVIDLYRKR